MTMRILRRERRRSTCGAAACLLAGLLGGCAAPDGTFAGVPWGTDAQELPALLAERGYELLMRFDDHAEDQMYAGVFQGHRSLVVARVGEAGLTKVLVGVVAPPERRPEVFHELAGVLRERYGNPLVVEGKHEPGRSEALHGARLLREAWAVHRGEGDTYVILEDRPDEGVVVSFEPPSWTTELRRRRMARLRETLLGGSAPFDSAASPAVPIRMVPFGH